jgi:type II restriction enzyme
MTPEMPNAMDLLMPAELAQKYKSPAQIARVVTEAWGLANLYCACCKSTQLNSSPANTQAYDFLCPLCSQSFQLKSKNSPIGRRIVDAALSAMMRAIREDRTPNLLALQYDRVSWTVRNLLLIPHFALTSSAIEARKPLGPCARRAGWIGCFIVLDNIPADARIHLVKNGDVVPAHSVRRSFARLKPIESVPVAARGWLLDVLRVVRSLRRNQFTNSDVYAFLPDLARIHPGNRHIKDKIRQQLQFLRDRGFLAQVEPGVWELID